MHNIFDKPRVKMTPACGDDNIMLRFPCGETRPFCSNCARHVGILHTSDVTGDGGDTTQLTHPREDFERWQEFARGMCSAADALYTEPNGTWKPTKRVVELLRGDEPSWRPVVALHYAMNVGPWRNDLSCALAKKLFADDRDIDAPTLRQMAMRRGDALVRGATTVGERSRKRQAAPPSEDDVDVGGVVGRKELMHPVEFLPTEVQSEILSHRSVIDFLLHPTAPWGRDINFDFTLLGDSGCNDAGYRHLIAHALAQFTQAKTLHLSEGCCKVMEVYDCAQLNQVHTLVLHTTEKRQHTNLCQLLGKALFLLPNIQTLVVDGYVGEFFDEGVVSTLRGLRSLRRVELASGGGGEDRLLFELFRAYGDTLEAVFVGDLQGLLRRWQREPSPIKVGKRKMSRPATLSVLPPRLLTVNGLHIDTFKTLTMLSSATTASVDALHDGVHYRQATAAIDFADDPLSVLQDCYGLNDYHGAYELLRRGQRSDTVHPVVVEFLASRHGLPVCPDSAPANHAVEIRELLLKMHRWQTTWQWSPTTHKLVRLPCGRVDRIPLVRESGFFAVRRFCRPTPNDVAEDDEWLTTRLYIALLERYASFDDIPFWVLERLHHDRDKRKFVASQLVRGWYGVTSCLPREVFDKLSVVAAYIVCYALHNGWFDDVDFGGVCANGNTDGGDVFEDSNTSVGTQTLWRFVFILVESACRHLEMPPQKRGDGLRIALPTFLESRLVPLLMPKTMPKPCSEADCVALFVRLVCSVHCGFYASAVNRLIALLCCGVYDEVLRLHQAAMLADVALCCDKRKLKHSTDFRNGMFYLAKDATWPRSALGTPPSFPTS